MKIIHRLKIAPLAFALLSGCAIAPPLVSTSPNDPSNPHAAEAATAPLRPGLVAGAKTSFETDGSADGGKGNP